MNEGENSVSSGGKPKTSFRGSRRYRAPSDEEQYNAATSLSSNPNTPEFFSDAVMANTVAPQPKRSRKGLIIGLIVVAILIIGAICAIVGTRSGIIGSAGEDDLSGNLKEEYRRFINLLVANNESSEKLDYNEIHKKQDKYFAQLIIDRTKESYSVDRSEYIEKLNNQFNKVEKLYVHEYGEDSDIYNIKQYYYYFIKIDRIYEGELIAKYNELGKDLTFDYINETYSTESNDKNLKIYNDNYRKIIQAELDAIEYGSTHGCIHNGVSNNACIKKMPGYSKLLTESNKYAQEAANSYRNLRTGANKSLVAINKKLFPEDYNSGSDNAKAGSTK